MIFFIKAYLFQMLYPTIVRVIVLVLLSSNTFNSNLPARNQESLTHGTLCCGRWGITDLALVLSNFTTNNSYHK